MHLRHFVTAVSAVLMGWLAVSYFHEVPAKHVVPMLPMATAEEIADEPVDIQPAVENSGLTVSVSP